MAIKKKESKPSTNVLPGDLDTLVHRAFTEQFMSSKYDDLFKGSKAEVLQYIEKSDDIEITQGEGFKTEYGSIILSERKNISIDKDKLAELVSDGTISVEQLLACVSTFKNEDLEKTLSTGTFNDIATKSASQTFTFKATGDFKAQCELEFDGGPVVPAGETAKVREAAKQELKSIPSKPSPSRVKEIVKEAAQTLSASEKAKAAVAKAKSKGSATDDLDAILKPKKGK